MKTENEICENCGETYDEHAYFNPLTGRWSKPKGKKKEKPFLNISGKQKMHFCKRFKPKTQNQSQDAEGILSSAGSAKTSDFQKHRLLTLDAREPAKISGIQSPQNNKPTAETDKAADTHSQETSENKNLISELLTPDNTPQTKPESALDLQWKKDFIQKNIYGKDKTADNTQTLSDFENGYQGVDKNDKSSLKIKEVFAKMQYQFYKGLECGRVEKEEVMQKILERIEEKRIKTDIYYNAGLNDALEIIKSQMGRNLSNG